MNTHIRELMVEAGYAAPEMAARATKLAELIILECSTCCEEYSVQILKFSQFGSNAAKDCASLIKEHFEVK